MKPLVWNFDPSVTDHVTAHAVEVHHVRVADTGKAFAQLENLGRTLGELRKATNEFRSTLEREIDVEQVKAARRDLDTATGGVTEVVDDLARVARRPHTLLTEETGNEAEKDPGGDSAETEPRS